MKVGIVGWRGMVGSVLMERMEKEGDFEGREMTFFSTSNAGGEGPKGSVLADANDLDALAHCDAIISCQGGDYTKSVHPSLRAKGWDGFWIDAASSLRMDENAMIVLDPINHGAIERGIESGVKDFAGGNCTVSLMLMALGGLFEAGEIEWLSSMTYQAASGAGAANMLELVRQAGFVDGECPKDLPALETEAKVCQALKNPDFPRDAFGHPLAYSLLPWIDGEVKGGQSKEEWKGMAETNKILGLEPGRLPVDGLCVRVGSLRCHSQAFTIKLKRDIPLSDVQGMIRSHNPWVRWIDNNKEATLSELTPAKVSGSLVVPIGRVHKMNMGPEYLTAFSVGDQLLWGAAEPLRRMLNILDPR